MTTPQPPLPSPLATALRQQWAIVVVIVICTLIETTLSLGDIGLLPVGRVRQTVYEFFGFWPGLLGRWTPNYPLQPYTMFVTYSFLHSGPVHLAVNMLTLYSLGRVVLDRVGTFGFVFLYTAAVLGGALGFGLLAKTTSPMVGASGGLFGLAGGVLAWNYVDRFSAARRLWPVGRAVTGLLALNLILWWLMDGLLAWQTHLGGFLAGWVAALLVDPRSIAAENQGDSPD
ncbi:rhomboid family intramembrane serine protease [uncultured Roseobacter sp.]|uniref:rhomboid family intramembrane serine protease n=3 Tax=uncultured Roseobacter sp. TaxID=114847 RepID=UPI00260C06B6|nr:rhomboid family intramembrane serine protease [uncultured Roseobacter sp.]